jgi:DNA-binding transcriptional LysR family regulator
VAATGTEGRDLRLSDILTFLQVYDKSLSANADTLNKLFATIADQAITTTIGRLERVTDFLFEEKPHLKPSKGPGFNALFTYQQGEGMRPTPAAQELHHHFSKLKDLYDKARVTFQNRLEETHFRRTPVRLGVPETIGSQWLAHACSCWQELFAKELELRLELSNSVDLLRQLDTGDFLDAVFAYGQQNRKVLPPAAGLSVQGTNELLEYQKQICFRSFDYHLNMVLLAHPASKIRLRSQSPDGDDINEGGKYWEKKIKPIQGILRPIIESGILIKGSAPSRKAGRDASQKTEDELTRLRTECFKQLKEINPRDIDYSQTQLIVVPSYAEPTELKVLIEDTRARFGVREAKNYNEAMALVRAGQGVTITNEPYWVRGHLTAFRLVGSAVPGGGQPYQRWFGVYYNASAGLKEAPLKVIAFLRAYMRRFEPYLRAGRSPAYGDPIYDEWVKTWRQTLSELEGPASDWTPAAFPVYCPRKTIS